MPLNVGDTAPDFELFTDDVANKTKVKLSSLRGKKVLLLFYPMDFSPVCTEEHCAFGPELGRIAPDKDTVVFGVSCDSPYSHAAFRRQYNIAYPLLSDPTRKMAKAYDMFAGEEPYNCSKRGTVVVGKDGRITYYHEHPMREARKVGDLSMAVAADVADEQRANEGGSAVR